MPFLSRDDAQVLRDDGQRAHGDVVASTGTPDPPASSPPCPFPHRRALRFPVTHVSYDRTVPGLSIGRPAMRSAGFARLPGDPAAALPGVRVVDGEEALRAEVRAAVAEHLGPVLGGFGSRMRRRGRTPWGMATDEMAEELRYVAHPLGEQQRAMRESELLLPGATRPYGGSGAFRVPTGPDWSRRPPGPGDQAVGRDRHLRDPHARARTAVP